MSIVTWTEVFSSLPDTGFFEVVRHYLGPVQTPFHKPDLVDQMEAFFNRKDVSDRVLAFIDAEDARFLSIIGYLDGTSGGRITGMVPDLRYVHIRERLLNLEERLLIWSRPSGKVRHYALTPLGVMVKDAGILGPGAVLGNGIESSVTPNMPWFDDNFLTSALAFLSEGISLFRKEGGWRKKALETLAERFPILFRDGRGEDRLILAGRGLLSAGLVERRDEKLVPILSAWRNIEGLDADERLRIIRTRAAVGRTVALEYAVPAVRLMIECLPAGRAFPQEHLSSLFQLAVGPAYLSPLGAKHVISHLELMGVLQSDEQGMLSRNVHHPGSDKGSHLSITPVGDIALRPGSPLFCNLALSARPEGHDIIAGFRMDKLRFQAGLDLGVSPTAFFEELELRSGRPLPPNIRTLCNEWETEHREMCLKVGVMLKAEGVRREIIEKTGVLEPFSFAHPAEGYWLLDPEEEPSWRVALTEVGIDRIPPVMTPSGTSLEPRPAAVRSEVPRIPWKSASREPALCRQSWKAHAGIDPAPVLDELRKAANGVSLSREELGAFRERLERRVILVPEQIRKGAWRYEVMTAKGLDYRGKIRLAEAAISGRDERLAVTVAIGNEIETFLILPRKLEKDGTDHVLVGISLPEEEEVRYKIRKIGFLKRIKASLF